MIASFANEYAGRFVSWIDRVAEEDPARAAALYLDAIEYHVPKLARTEMTGKDGGPVDFNWLK